jgi:hypothetical protein
MVFKKYLKISQSQNILIVSGKILQDALLQFLRNFSEKTFMKISILDISEMSNSEYMGKVYIEKSVVPFFKYFDRKII